MTLSKAVWIIVISIVVCGLGRGCIGGLLGRLAPEYYRTVFRSIPADLDLAKVGFGLGLTQGFIAGVAIGCVMVIGLAIARRS